MDFHTSCVRVKETERDSAKAWCTQYTARRHNTQHFGPVVERSAFSGAYKNVVTGAGASRELTPIPQRFRTVQILPHSNDIWLKIKAPCKLLDCLQLHADDPDLLGNQHGSIQGPTPFVCSKNADVCQQPCKVCKKQKMHNHYVQLWHKCTVAQKYHTYTPIPRECSQNGGWCQPTQKSYQGHRHSNEGRHWRNHRNCHANEDPKGVEEVAQRWNCKQNTVSRHARKKKIKVTGQGHSQPVTQGPPAPPQPIFVHLFLAMYNMHKAFSILRHSELCILIYNMLTEIRGGGRKKQKKGVVVGLLLFVVVFLIVFRLFDVDVGLVGWLVGWLVGLLAVGCCCCCLRVGGVGHTVCEERNIKESHLYSHICSRYLIILQFSTLFLGNVKGNKSQQHKTLFRPIHTFYNLTSTHL